MFAGTFDSYAVIIMRANKIGHKMTGLRGCHQAGRTGRVCVVE